MGCNGEGDVELGGADLLLSSRKVICSYRWPPRALRRSLYMIFDRGDSYPVMLNFIGRLVSRSNTLAYKSERGSLFNPAQNGFSEHLIISK